ncbi:MAG: hypothetical protein ACFFFT_00325 [Candidatus Thorarchaeota archaeon]
MDDLYDNVIIEFNNSYDEGNQWVLIYKAIIKLLHLTENNPEWFVSGLPYLIGLISILNDH